jgi:hypothetical protein
MKKFLSLAAALIIGVNAHTFNLVKGWQLLGTNQDINVSVFNNSNIISVWTYDKNNKKWKAFLPNSSIDLSKYNIDNLEKINKDEGFWVNAKSNIEFSTMGDKLLDDVMENGLLGLKGKTVYFWYMDNFFSSNKKGDEGTITFKENSFEYKAKNGANVEAIAYIWDKNTVIEKGNENEIFRFMKIDPETKLIFIHDNDGISVVSTSEETIKNYENSIANKYPATAVDAIDLKGKYLYYISHDNDFNIKAVKFTDNNLEYYNIDNFDDDVNDDSYKFAYSKNISYLGGNKINLNGKTYYVYKTSLANKDVDVFELAAGFEFEDLAEFLNELGLKSIKFTKGNVYCFGDDMCYLDFDAMKDLYSAIVNVNTINAIKKGSPKTPTYTKLSDYLKNNVYYGIWNDYDWITLNKDYIDGNNFKSENIATLSGNDIGESDMAPIAELDNIVKVIAEYDNGILLEVYNNGFVHRHFFYNNLEDAKKVYEKLLPIYKKYNQY